MKPSPAVVGKPFARFYAILRDKPGSNIKRPRAASQPYEPGELPARYNWPTGIDVVPLKIVIGELGGKFYVGDVDLWTARMAAKMGVDPASIRPNITTHLLPGADDSPSDADGEVAVDWQAAAEAYTWATGLPATIVIVYGPNSGDAFTAVTTYCNALSGVGAGSWSWGSGEPNWVASERAAYDAEVQKSPYPWEAASGDNGSNDGSNSPTTDFPASSPYVTGCGGTSCPQNGPENVWNNGNGEGTGGGFSGIYARPAWQPANSQGVGRMVPDWAADADPNTGKNTVVNGVWQDIGGTSVVSPQMAGFMCAVNGARLKAGLPMIGQANPIIWSMPSGFLDVTSGTNGAYSATTGPDPCTGLGRPLGTLFSLLTGASQNPPPLPPPVVPPPGPTPTPTPAFTLGVPRTVPKGSRFTVLAGKTIPAGSYSCYPKTGALESQEDSVAE